MKRFERPMLGFLSREEMMAVLGQTGSSWSSQRDHLLLATLYNTGARVSEIIRAGNSGLVAAQPAPARRSGLATQPRRIRDDALECRAAA